MKGGIEEKLEPKTSGTRAVSKVTLVEQILSGFHDPGQSKSFIKTNVPYTAVEYENFGAAIYAKVPPELFFPQLIGAYQNLKTDEERAIFIHNAQALIKQIIKADVNQEFKEKTKNGIEKLKEVIKDPEFYENLNGAFIAADKRKSDLQSVVGASASSSKEMKGDYLDNPSDLADDLKNHQLKVVSNLRLGNYHNKNFEKKDKAQQVAEFADDFNTVTAMVTTDILSASNKDEQKQRYQFYIKVLEQCLEKGDYISAQEIRAALQGPSVSRLKYLQSELSADQRASFENSDRILSPTKNYAALKEHMQNKKKDTTVVPPINLLNQAVTFIEDGNPNKTEYKNPNKKDKTPLQKDNEDKILMEGKELTNIIYVQNQVITMGDITQKTNFEARLSEEPKLSDNQRVKLWDQASLAIRKRGDDALLINENPTFTPNLRERLQDAAASVAPKTPEPAIKGVGELQTGATGAEPPPVKSADEVADPDVARINQVVKRAEEVLIEAEAFMDGPRKNDSEDAIRGQHKKNFNALFDLERIIEDYKGKEIFKATTSSNSYDEKGILELKERVLAMQVAFIDEMIVKEPLQPPPTEPTAAVETKQTAEPELTKAQQEAERLKQENIALVVKIERSELEGRKWEKEETKAQCPNLNAVIDANNRLTEKVRQDIFQADNPAAVYSYYVEVLDAAVKARDYNTAFTIGSALNYELRRQNLPEERKALLRGLPADEQTKEMLKKNQALLSPEKGFKAIRDEMKNNKANGYVPPMVVLTSDLFKVEDAIVKANEGQILTQKQRQINLDQKKTRNKFVDEFAEQQVILGGAKPKVAQQKEGPSVRDKVTKVQKAGAGHKTQGKPIRKKQAATKADVQPSAPTEPEKLKQPAANNSVQPQPKPQTQAPQPPVVQTQAPQPQVVPKAKPRWLPLTKKQAESALRTLTDGGKKVLSEEHINNIKNGLDKSRLTDILNVLNNKVTGAFDGKINNAIIEKHSAELYALRGDDAKFTSKMQEYYLNEHRQDFKQQLQSAVDACSLKITALENMLPFARFNPELKKSLNYHLSNANKNMAEMKQKLENLDDHIKNVASKQDRNVALYELIQKEHDKQAQAKPAKVQPEIKIEPPATAATPQTVEEHLATCVDEINRIKSEIIAVAKTGQVENLAEFKEKCVVAKAELEQMLDTYDELSAGKQGGALAIDENRAQFLAPIRDVDKVIKYLGRGEIKEVEIEPQAQHDPNDKGKGPANEEQEPKVTSSATVAPITPVKTPVQSQPTQQPTLPDQGPKEVSPPVDEFAELDRVIEEKMAEAQKLKEKEPPPIPPFDIESVEPSVPKPKEQEPPPIPPFDNKPVELPASTQKPTAVAQDEQFARLQQQVEAKRNANEIARGLRNVYNNPPLTSVARNQSMARISFKIDPNFKVPAFSQALSAMGIKSKINENAVIIKQEDIPKLLEILNDKKLATQLRDTYDKQLKADDPTVIISPRPTFIAEVAKPTKPTKPTVASPTTAPPNQRQPISGPNSALAEQARRLEAAQEATRITGSQQGTRTTGVVDLSELVPTVRKPPILHQAQGRPIRTTEAGLTPPTAKSEAKTPTQPQTPQQVKPQQTGQVPGLVSISNPVIPSHLLELRKKQDAAAKGVDAPKGGVRSKIAQFEKNDSDQPTNRSPNKLNK